MEKLHKNCEYLRFGCKRQFQSSIMEFIILIMFAINSVVTGIGHDFNKIADTLKSVNVSQYWDKAKVVDDITHFLGNGTAVAVVIYFIFLILAICFICVPFFISGVLNYILASRLLSKVEHNYCSDTQDKLERKYTITKVIAIATTIIASIPSINVLTTFCPIVFNDMIITNQMTSERFTLIIVGFGIFISLSCVLQKKRTKQPKRSWRR